MGSDALSNNFHSFNRLLGAITGVGPRLAGMEESLLKQAQMRGNVIQSPGPRSLIESGDAPLLRMLQLPSQGYQLPPQVETEETTKINAQKAAAWLDNMKAWMMGNVNPNAIAPWLIQTGYNTGTGASTYGIPPPPVPVPDPGSPALKGDRPAATGAPAPGGGAVDAGGSAKPPARIGKAPQRATFTTDAGETLPGTLSGDGMSFAADNGRSFVFDTKTRRIIEAPRADLSAAPPPPLPAAEAPAASGAAVAPSLEPPPPGPALPGTRPGGGVPAPVTAAPSPAPAPAAEAVPPALARPPEEPAPTPPGAPAPPVATTPPAIPGATPTPVAPAGLSPSDLEDLELLAPGSTGKVGYPSGAPAETGAVAGALAGTQLAQAAPGLPARADVAGTQEKPGPWTSETAMRYGTAVGKDPDLWDYIASKGYKTDKEAWDDNHVKAMVHDWWVREDARTEGEKAKAKSSGAINTAVQRQIASIESLERVMNLAAWQRPGEEGSAMDVPVSEEWARSSRWMESVLGKGGAPGIGVGPGITEAFSAGGTGLIGDSWLTLRDLANKPDHPWSRQAAELLSLRGAAGLGVRSFGDVGTMTDTEKKLFEDYYLPSPIDTPEGRWRKWQNTQTILGEVKKGMYQGVLTNPAQIKAYLQQNHPEAPLFFHDPDAPPAAAPAAPTGAPEPVSARHLERTTPVARRLGRSAVG